MEVGLPDAPWVPHQVPGDFRAEQWDCETIVSLRSNQDNHPALLGGGGGTGKTKGKGKGMDGGVGEEEGMEAPPRRIALSSKSGLPLGYVPSRGPVRGGGAAARWGASAAAAGAPGSLSGSEEDEDDGEGDEVVGKRPDPTARKPGETPEERKARKAAVKSDRRDARASKSATKVGAAV